jgi:Acetyltransferase (isoleucine patch superfamily)
MIKNVLLAVIDSCISFFWFFFRYKNHLFLLRLQGIVYSSWLKHEFKKVGKFFKVGRTINLRGGEFIEIGNNVDIGKNVVLNAWGEYGCANVQRFSPRIEIGNDVVIGDWCHITSINRIVIGDGVLLGRWITISDNSHGQSTSQDVLITPRERPLFSKGPTVIGKNVWIGDKATICPGVNIGDNSIIGANCVVTKNIPENCVVVGNPGVVVRHII